MLRRSRTGLGLLTASLAVALTGCGGGSGSTSSEKVNPTNGGTTCDKYGDIILKVGLSEAGEAIADGFKGLVSEFEKANPKVKVDLQVKDFASSLQTIKLVMSGDNPPD